MIVKVKNMEINLKLCRECKHLHFEEKSGDASCKIVVDPVSGSFIRCFVARSDTRDSALSELFCGVQGNYWEAADGS